ncbi:hypothetical protein DHEL01_v212516 [Diaporthe helianthi]|uniref:Uncharacterized protein n=1 Tax=Diaporthe helianthi TaxID=158607 RepID=A0A2P5HFS7_DIAHE|nr:hypothetical protein DHEL01_v212516 [Diaporthe helianthi]
MAPQPFQALHRESSMHAQHMAPITNLCCSAAQLLICPSAELYYRRLTGATAAAAPTLSGQQ